MYSYSDFKFTKTDLTEIFEVPMSSDYKVFLCGKEIPVYSCRISEYSFNRWWPGYQRPVNQTELVSYINLVSDEEIELTVQPLSKKEYSRIMIKPYSKGVSFTKDGDNIKFRLAENGAYVLELDDYHGLLYIFNNSPVPCEDKEKVTYCFGPGVHFPGRIELKSGESVYADKDALIYGCIAARDAENIRVYGNGVFDDSWEERHNQHCYTPYTNGNIKFYNCKNVEMTGCGYTNSALWCFNLYGCRNVTVDGMNIFGQWRYNTDGIDMLNCTGVTIRNSFVHSFDDTVVIKGVDKYSHISCEDILVENCVVWCDWGNTLEIGFETAACEYKNITYRNIDILRGANNCCNIHNGDWAYVHGILYENINIELESFYSPAVLQTEEEMSYPEEKKKEIEVTRVLGVNNYRFRDAYKFIVSDVQGNTPGEKTFACAKDVLVKNVHVYADEKVLETYGTKCVNISVVNIIDTTEYGNIKVENVYLNGKKLSEEDMQITLQGVGENVLTVK